jgi:hypothetical protein
MPAPVKYFIFQIGSPPMHGFRVKHDQLLKRNRWNNKQINRRNPLHVIAKEVLPGLQWSIPPRHHIDRNRGLGDLDAELEQLAIDLGRAPEWVLISILILRIRSRVSLPIRDRSPGERDFHRQ